FLGGLFRSLFGRLLSCLLGSALLGRLLRRLTRSGLRFGNRGSRLHHSRRYACARRGTLFFLFFVVAAACRFVAVVFLVLEVVLFQAYVAVFLVHFLIIAGVQFLVVEAHLSS